MWNQGKFNNGSHQFQEGLSGLDRFIPAQRQQVQGLSLRKAEAGASLEARLSENRQCPHCDTSGTASRGMARGLRRYQCKVCKKTFNAAIGTILQGLHKKGRWLTIGECLADGLTVPVSTKRCSFAISTAFRWQLKSMQG